MLAGQDVPVLFVGGVLALDLGNDEAHYALMVDGGEREEAIAGRDVVVPRVGIVDGKELGAQRLQLVDIAVCQVPQLDVFPSIEIVAEASLLLLLLLLLLQLLL